MFGWVLNTLMWKSLDDCYCIYTYAVYSSTMNFWLVLMFALNDLNAVEWLPRNRPFFDVLCGYTTKNCKFVDMAVFLEQFWLLWTFTGGNTWELTCTLLDFNNYGKKHFKTVITGIWKSKIRPNCNAIHQNFQKKLEINLTKDDISNKINFLTSEEYFIKQTYVQRRFFLFHGKCWW